MTKVNEKEERGLYVFFTYDISVVGGSQMYVYGKALELQQEGWDVAVFTGACKQIKAGIPFLATIAQESSLLFSKYVPGNFTDEEIDIVVKETFFDVDIDPGSYEMILYESHDDVLALWGEAFAKRTGGFHAVTLLNEFFDAEFQRYIKYSDFYMFKFYRKELHGGVGLLLKVIAPDISAGEFSGWCAEKEPIEEVADDRITAIPDDGIRIAYIGRGAKEYVPEVLRQIKIFMKKHNSGDIVFITVGDMTDAQKMIKELVSSTDISYIPMGDMVPIPKSLFQKLNVIIANSQTAKFCAYEGKPVIVMNSTDYLANGIMGYTCTADEAVVRGEGKPALSLSECLEDVIRDHSYLQNEFNMPKKIDTAEYYKESILEFLNTKEENSVDYYDVANVGIEDRWQGIDAAVARRVLFCGKSDVKAIESCHKVTVFGAGEDGIKCMKWLDTNQPDIEYFVVDNAVEKVGTLLHGHQIKSTDVISHKHFDAVIVASTNHYDEIYDQLRSELNVSEEKIILFNVIENELLYRVLKKMVEMEER